MSNKIDNIIKYELKKYSVEKEEIKKGIKAILSHFGSYAQRIKSAEELSELIKAVLKNEKSNVMEEIADVEIMIYQLKLIYNINDADIHSIKLKKVYRTLEIVKQFLSGNNRDEGE